MTQKHAERYPVDPWVLREVGLDLNDLARSESLFALSNGHIGARGFAREAALREAAALLWALRPSLSPRQASEMAADIVAVTTTS